MSATRPVVSSLGLAALLLGLSPQALADEPVPYTVLPWDVSLGGPYGQAWKINNAGQIIGNIQGGAALWAPDGTLTLLSDYTSQVYDLNSQGQVVGTIGLQGVVWGPDGTVLHTLSHGTRNIAYSINDLGDVVGMSGPFNAETGSGWFWSEDTGFVDIVPPTGTPQMMWPAGPNGARQVAGYYRPSNNVFRTFFWSDATGFLPVAGTINSRVGGFNDAGVVVGALDPLDDSEAFSWTISGGLRHLDAPDGLISTANDVNESGQICGAARGTDFGYRLLTWDADGTMHDRGSPVGQTAYARVINEHGHVAGDATSADMDPWFWSEQTGFILLDHPAGSRTFITGMNDYGQVVGFSSGSPNLPLTWQVDLGPQIAVGTATLDFGLTEVGDSQTAVITVSNVGSGSLVVDAMSLSGDAGFGLATSVPLVVTAGASADVTVSFAPTAAGLASTTLTLHTSDIWHPVTTVALSGEGVAAPQPQDLDAVLDWFDEAVADQTLVGAGPGKSAAGRLGALRGMIETAGEYLAAGDVEAAKAQLLEVLRRVDGNSQPPDFASGAAAAEFALIVADVLGWL